MHFCTLKYNNIFLGIKSRVFLLLRKYFFDVQGRKGNFFAVIKFVEKLNLESSSVSIDKSTIKWMNLFSYYRSTLFSSRVHSFSRRRFLRPLHGATVACVRPVFVVSFGITRTWSKYRPPAWFGFVMDVFQNGLIKNPTPTQDSVDEAAHCSDRRAYELLANPLGSFGHNLCIITCNSYTHTHLHTIAHILI